MPDLKVRLSEMATSIVAVVEPETSAAVAAQLMRKDHIGSLVVVDADDQSRPVGIVTDRDLVLALMAEGLDPELFTVGDVMSVDLVLGHPDMDLLEAACLMRHHRLRRLVITDQAGRLVGLLALEDVLDHWARELSGFAEAMRGGRDREFSQRV